MKIRGKEVFLFCDEGNGTTPFFKQVYTVVEQIPYGRVVSYGQIARMLGRPRAARMVGWAMRSCPGNLPWQRVVMTDGSITGGVYANIRKDLLKPGFPENITINMQQIQ